MTHYEVTRPIFTGKSSRINLSLYRDWHSVGRGHIPSSSHRALLTSGAHSMLIPLQTKRLVVQLEGTTFNHSKLNLDLSLPEKYAVHQEININGL